jgi:hypothetical protein
MPTMLKFLTFITALIAVIPQPATAAPELIISGRWSVEKANEWYAAQPWLLGCNFIPSTAVNQLEMWQADTFDPVTIERELGWAADIGMNSVRVYLHDLLWQQDHEGFLKRIDQYLGIAEKHHIKTMFVLFDSCWGSFPQPGPQPAPKPHTHNSRWLQSPHIDLLKDVRRHGSLEPYVSGVIGRFKDDPRVLAWDIYNEPGNGSSSDGMRSKQKTELCLSLIEQAFVWARKQDPKQPLTLGLFDDEWSGPDIDRLTRFVLDQSDVISFHNYGPLDETIRRVDSVKATGRPLLCTEFMARVAGSRLETHLPYFKEHGIAAFNWGLVAGKIQTQYPWESGPKRFSAEPELWHHDILRPDGSPHRQSEVDLMKSLAVRVQAGGTDHGGLLAYWPFESFEQAGEHVVTGDPVGYDKDEVRGHSRLQEGVRGNCLVLNEFDSEVARPQGGGPLVTGKAFTFEAWIAPRSYPWNWAPIVMQRDDNSGFYFGIDGDGRLGLHVAVGGKWFECNSEMPFAGLLTEHQWNSDSRRWQYFGPGKAPDPEPFGEKTGKPTIPLLRWSHVAGTFDPSVGIRIYLDGKPLAAIETQGEMSPAANSELRIGRDVRPMRPTHTERPKNTNPFNYSFDGLFDEIKVHDRALSAEQVDAAFREIKPRIARPLEYRKIPTGPAGPGKFGAYHTRLEYDIDYDRPRPFGPQQDVVVRFDEHAFKLVFWNGINNYPVWYAENDIGLMWEAVETSGPLGCHEAMMDRQCRYSHVRILESNDARVRIHWRHAPCNIEYGLAHVDPVTGWGDWCDEYLTIYPDGVAARELVHWCPLPNGRHTYEQDNFIIPIGMTPAEVLHKEAITLANLNGEESKLDWAGTGAPKGRNIENASILKYNIKATAKPFMILHPELAKVAIEGNGKPWPHCFFWWNHWPVSAIPSDGKQIYMVDGRPSSTSVSGNTYTTRHELNDRTGNSLRQIWLLGMTTDRSAGALAPLARSWSRPPDVSVESTGVTSGKYSLGQRCYELTCKAPVKQPIDMVIAASEQSPVVNLPLVFSNFGDAEVVLEVDGKPLPRGKDFRYSHVATLDGLNLCAWIRLESMKPVRLKLIPE